MKKKVRGKNEKISEDVLLQNSQTIFLEEFLSNRAKNLYVYSSNDLEDPRSLHFSKFPEQLPEIPH